MTLDTTGQQVEAIETADQANESDEAKCGYLRYATGGTLTCIELFEVVGLLPDSTPVWIWDGTRMRALEDCDDMTSDGIGLVLGFDGDPVPDSTDTLTTGDVLTELGDLDDETPVIGHGLLNDGTLHEGVVFTAAVRTDHPAEYGIQGDHLVLHVAPRAYWPAAGADIYGDPLPFGGRPIHEVRPADSMQGVL